MSCHCKWKLGENKEISINPGKIYKAAEKLVNHKSSAKRRQVQKKCQDEKHATFEGRSLQKGKR